MRLTCPNCGAQYEVPDGVIPEDGRDVQCSNCGDTWFQAHPDAEQARAAAPDPIRPTRPRQDLHDSARDSATARPDAPDNRPRAEAERPVPTQGEAILTDDPAPGFDAAADYDQATDHPAEASARPATTPPRASPDFSFEPSRRSDAPAPPSQHYDDEDGDEALTAATLTAATAARRRKIDPAVADVLREEAEHEQKVRNAHAGLESQPELGLTTGDSGQSRREREARERTARLRGQPDPDTALEDDATRREMRKAGEANASRRDLLPDIDEINSTLRSASEAEEDIEAPYRDERATRRGYRFGFFLVLFLAAAGLGVYVFAEEIAARFPATTLILDSYIIAIDEGRIWLDRMARRAAQWLETKSQSISS
ncbi:zinc-ribbon domain-containing protein [Pseudooceanicola aestuarii]|uniref:zinc-ribbon domain-containing protein n=1 Tax=Pseudooceanicola aestuarii TaxID=2697319 RepID=UPI0013D0B24F|nr:zinc-ribbon domain-containing protein [Pseudooceanicola aestuarii]